MSDQCIDASYGANGIADNNQGLPNRIECNEHNKDKDNATGTAFLTVLALWIFELARVSLLAVGSFNLPLLRLT